MKRKTVINGLAGSHCVSDGIRVIGNLGFRVEQEGLGGGQIHASQCGSHGKEAVLFFPWSGSINAT